MTSLVVSTLIVVSVTAVALAATPSAFVNYQGVLKDASGNPLSGTFDVTFRLWSASSGGDEILIDRHTAAAGNAVTASGGSFQAMLGAGSVADGSGPGTYASLDQVFRDHGDVYLEISVGAETPSSRVRLGAAGGTPSAGPLDGKPGQQLAPTADFGIVASGSDAGGYFYNTGSASQAYVASPNYGINAYGGIGGYFQSVQDGSGAEIGSAGLGIKAYGHAGGGYFEALNGSGFAYVGYGDVGIRARGTPTAADFDGDVTMSGALRTASGQSVAVRDMCAELTGSGSCDIAAAMQFAARRDSISIVDGEGYAGTDNAIAIGTDGAPVISYQSGAHVDLKVAKCNNVSCSSATLRQVDSVAGWNSSIVIGSDGFPVISYLEGINKTLKVAKCNDANCDKAILSTLDSVGGGSNRGQRTSIAIGADGRPVIAYYDNINHDLKVGRCGNASCSSASRRVVDSAGDVGLFSSLAIGADGFPVISYFDSANNRLKLAKCNDPNCFSATLRTLDSAFSAGAGTSIAIGMDGFPVIGYLVGNVQDLKVAKCNDASCFSATLTTVDSAGYVGRYPSLAIGADGLPVISYYDTTNRSLKVAKCGDPGCRFGFRTILRTLDGAGESNVFGGTSIAIGRDELPVISYMDMTNGDLKVISHVWFAPSGAGPDPTAAQSRSSPPRRVGAGAEMEPPDMEPALIAVASSQGDAASPQRAEGSGKNTTAGREGEATPKTLRLQANSVVARMIVNEPVEPGDVVTLDPTRSSGLRRARVAGDPGVVGIVGTESGVVFDEDARPEGREEATDSHRADDRENGTGAAADASTESAIVIVGVAMCKVDAAYGPIRPGDLLTTSATPGHAARAGVATQGTIIGKALEPLQAGTGIIKVLVMPR